jgi:hypothetical protein
VSANIDVACDDVFAGKPAPTKTQPCRSRLAGEGGVSANIDVACDDVFAGKPTPTGNPVPSEKIIVLKRQ